MNIPVEIQTILKQKLNATRVEVIDDSHLHAGHEGAKQGGHYTVTVVSRQFKGKSPAEQHKMVYSALAALLPGKIHALKLKAMTDSEGKH